MYVAKHFRKNAGVDADTIDRYRQLAFKKVTICEKDTVCEQKKKNGHFVSAIEKKNHLQ